MRVKEPAASGTKPRAYAVRCRWLPWSPRAHRWAGQLLSASPGGDDLISAVIFAIVLVPLIVVLAIGAIGRIVSLTPEVGAAESQVLAALDPVRSGLLLAVAGFVHGIFSAPWVYGIIAALTAWLALVKRSGRDAAGFAVTAVTMVVVASTAQQIIGRPAPGLGDGVLTAEVGSSLPSAVTASTTCAAPSTYRCSQPVASPRPPTRRPRSMPAPSPSRPERPTCAPRRPVRR